MADQTPSHTSSTSDTPSANHPPSVLQNPDPSSPSLLQTSVVQNLDPYANPLFLHAADSSSFILVSEKLQEERIENLSEIGSLILYLDEADVIWHTLETQYKQKNVSKIFNVEQKIESLQQGALDLNTFYTKLNTLWEELKNYEPYPICSCGGCSCHANAQFVELVERRKVVQFLMKLNESYHPARRQILMLEPLPSISKVYNLVSQEEHQRQVRSSSTDPVVFQASASRFPRSRFTPLSQGKPRPVCAHCGLKGHTIHRCYKLHGYPPSSRSFGSSQPPLLPTPRSGMDSNLSNPVNLVVSESGLQSKPSMTSDASLSTMAQAQALFDNFQSQLKLLGSSSKISDSVAVTESTTNLTPGPYAGLDDWEG
ncbi:PREDICTED: uncharacterized protein LOC104823067 [Tarenaya hassleriana]|uniref:uncharacterized protein LOC104823067 n=1 Tax=Tarenaya hassleriana TaxID=28532 RepID=UPI00053C99CE|nr:PREDICTED: uncharacterized protein LOC104823067 [Tarenaya hassleriana]